MKKLLTTSEALYRLSLPTKTSKQEVRKRYRVLAKLYHPDQSEGFSSQAEAIQQFIDIHEAYEYLINLPGEEIVIPATGSATDRPAPNPLRGTYVLPDWLFIRELNNSISLWRLMLSKQTKLRSMWWSFHFLFRKIPYQQDRNYLVQFLIHILNILKWLSVSLIYLSIFVLLILLLTSVVLCFTCFYPFLLTSDQLHNFLMNQYEKKYGYRASATCGYLKGELTYLLLRITPTLCWCALTVLVWITFAPESLMLLMLFAPFGLFAAVLLSSNVYEWVCFVKVRKWRTTQC